MQNFYQSSAKSDNSLDPQNVKFDCKFSFKSGKDAKLKMKQMNKASLAEQLAR
jgi:hypothetical protein